MMLDVTNLSVDFALDDGRTVHAVRDVTLRLEPGERVGLVGESGCGKTTTMLALMGLLPPSASVGGSVVLNGSDVLERGEESARRYRWKDIAMVFQGAMNAFNPVKRVGAQIVEPMEFHGIASGKTAWKRAAELVQRAGLSPSVVHQYPHELSGGMRQRAGIAMALACRPKVLLADEPTTGLDVIVQARILALLTELATEFELALIFVTHDLPIVAQVCERMMVMYAGGIVEASPVERLRHKQMHPYTTRLLESSLDMYSTAIPASIPGAPPRLDAAIVGCPFEPRCSEALARCATDVPILKQVEPGRIAACHLNDLPRPERIPSIESSA
jgi:peptide/nickel transport system ATP-binding protein